MEKRFLSPPKFLVRSGRGLPLVKVSAATTETAPRVEATVYCSANPGLPVRFAARGKSNFPANVPGNSVPRNQRLAAICEGTGGVTSSDFIVRRECRGAVGRLMTHAWTPRPCPLATPCLGRGGRAGSPSADRAAHSMILSLPSFLAFDHDRLIRVSCRRTCSRRCWQR